MARSKRRRYAQLRTMTNVVDARTSHPQWFEKTFGRDAPVTLELGCGKGEYALALARRRPAQGVLGVDRNGARLWAGAARALDEGLSNVFFLRAPVEQLEIHVPPARTAEIWIPFPDPLPKNRQARRRLVSPSFLASYRRLLRPTGVVVLRTDDIETVAFAEASMVQLGGRVREVEPTVDAEPLQAHSTYERRFREEGRVIHERRFSFD